MAGLPIVFDIPVKLLPEIVLSIVEPDERILSIFLPNANNRITNCIRCRYNRLFAFPFCVVCPCAMCCFCACGCCELVIARQNFKFTKLHEGSILVITEKRLIHFTPTVQGCCILPISEQVQVVDWTEYVSTTGRVTVNTNFGGRFSDLCCLCNFAAQCCFLHCIRKWEDSHDSGYCAFEDTNVSISYTQDDIPRELTFAPDLRAPQIRGILQAAAKKCKKMKKINNSSNSSNTNASKPNSPSNSSNSGMNTASNTSSNANSIKSNTNINANSNRQSSEPDSGGIKVRESHLGPTNSPASSDTQMGSTDNAYNTKTNGCVSVNGSPSNCSVSSTIESSTLFTQGAINHANINMTDNAHFDNDSYSDINSYYNGFTITKVIDTDHRGYAPLSIDVSSPRYKSMENIKSPRSALSSRSLHDMTPMSAFNAVADTVSTVSTDFNDAGNNVHNPSVEFRDVSHIHPRGGHKVHHKSAKNHARSILKPNPSSRSSLEHLHVDNKGNIGIPSNLGIASSVGNVDTVNSGHIGGYGNSGGYDNYEEPVDYDGNRYGIAGDNNREFGNNSIASSSTINLDQVDAVSGTFDGVSYSNVGDISVSLVSISSVKGSRTSPRAKKSSKSRVNNAASFLANAVEASHSSQQSRRTQSNLDGTRPS